jgi:hypothetical protein
MTALPATLGLSLALAAGVALAEPPVNHDRLQVFPHVRVENAPVPVDQTRSTAKQQGMQVAVDSNGKLRPVTAEEAQKLAALKGKAHADQRSLQRDAAGAKSDSDAGLRTIYGPGNTVGVMLGEESMVYQVIHKTDEGLEIREYTGKKAAERAVNPEATPEVAHEPK